MADDSVGHRFVQIYQACETITLSNNEYWDTIASHSAIAVSHCCEKLFTLVTVEKKLDILQTIQSLQNIVLTSKDTAKTALFIRLITRLLIHNKNSNGKKFVFHHSKTDQYKVHPFTAIFKQKPEAYYNLLEEVDYLFKEKQDVMAILDGFISAIFLTEHTIDANAILTRLGNNIMLFANKDPSLLISIYNTFVQLLYSYPMKKDHNRYFMILDFLLWINITLAPFSSVHIDQFSINDFVFTFFDRMLTVVSEDYPIIAYLNRLERIMQAGVADEVLDIVWSGLSFALLKVSSLEEQQSIMEMKKTILESSACHILVLRVGYLPLYKLMSELSDKNVSLKLKNLKNTTLDVIAYLEHRKPTSSDATQSVKKLQDIINRNKLYGLLSHLFVYLYQLYNGISPIENDNYNSGSNTTVLLNMLFSSPFVHSEKDNKQCITYTRIAELSSMQETSYKFPVFLFLLRRLRSNSDNPHIVTHLFKNVIPTIADPNDPIMTSKVLQVILSSISSGNNSTMACLGVRALLKTHEIQPRIWQELKRVFTEWVLRRKSVTLRRRIDLSNTGPIKMELAILTAMRDVCRDRPRECAPDVLPMIMSLLQSCQDLSIASLSIMVATLNHCVKAGLVEPRSIWNISIVYLAQYAFEHGVKKSSLLIQQLCEFYSIAGARNDNSEPYMQFKESLLSEYVLPLLELEGVSEHAMKALSNFSAQDIMTTLPEKATDYVKKATPDNDCPNANQHLVLSVLASNELDHMRRGLFKEENSTKQPVVPVTTDVKLCVNDAGQVVGEREGEIRSKFTENWENARVAPGLRSGYAIAMLHMIDLPPTPKIKSKEEVWNVIGKLKWYRFMITQFTDISLTDHLLLRISSVGSWETFFKNALLIDSENDLEVMVGLLVQDLMGRLERSTVPGVTCNIALAVAGLISALRSFMPSFAASCASEVIEKIMHNYVDLAGSPLSHSAHLMSEEVQFAARFALGYLGPCIISNEKFVQSVFNNLIDSAVNSHAKYRNIDTAVDLVQFANGFAAGHFVAELGAYPSMTESIEKMKDSGMTSLLNYCRTQTISDSRIMGILIGLASGLRAELMTDELSFAIESLQLYLSGQEISKGCLLGSLWLGAVGAKEENCINYEISGLVESALASASNDPNLAQHFYHFTVCYTQIQYHSYLFADASSNRTEEFYTQAFAPLLNSIETDDASSNYRIASLFGISSLFGVNYIYTNRETVYLEAQRYYPQSRQAALDKIAHVAGINSRSAPTGNLKSGRVAAAVCGKLIEHVMLLQHVLDSEQGESKADSTSLLSASSEPSNYNRLNSNISYLRAMFDQLVLLASTNQENNISMLLESLIKTPGPLPPVNWFNVLVKIVKISPRLQELCFLFASTHSANSFSLSEFLMTQTTSLVKHVNSMAATDIHFLFAEGGALDILLELSGLNYVDKATETSQRRGMNAVVKKISISNSRILELIQLLCQKFQWLNQDTQYSVLAQIASHVRGNKDEDKKKLITSIRDHVYQAITVPLLNDSKSDAWILKKAIECGVSDVEQILPMGRPSDWKDVPNALVLNRVIALCEYYNLQNTDRQHLAKYMSTALTYLIGLPVDEADPAWIVIAETIEQDCRSDRDVLGWMIRVLDAFVVYVSGFDGPEEYSDEQLMQSIQIGLRAILMELTSNFADVPVTEIEVADTIYLLSCIVMIGESSPSQQEQIVKRLFKLLDMVGKLESKTVFAFFKQVCRSFPQPYLVQYENKY